MPRKLELSLRNSNVSVRTNTHQSWNIYSTMRLAARIFKMIQRQSKRSLPSHITVDQVGTLQETILTVQIHEVGFSLFDQTFSLIITRKIAQH